MANATRFAGRDGGTPRSGPGQVPDPHQVVDGQPQGEHPANPADAPMPGLAKQRHGLGPAEDLLDELSLALTHRVARMSGRPAVDGTPAGGGLLGDVGRDPERAERGDE